MKTNQGAADNQNNQSPQGQLSDLLNEAKEINQETDKINEEAMKNIKDIDAKIDASINDIEQIFSDLDQIEKEAGDEIDRLVLKQAEDLTSE